MNKPSNQGFLPTSIKSNHGLTLMEVLVYTALSGLLVLVVSQYLLTLGFVLKEGQYRTNQPARTTIQLFRHDFSKTNRFYYQTNSDSDTYRFVQASDTVVYHYRRDPGTLYRNNRKLLSNIERFRVYAPTYPKMSSYFEISLKHNGITLREAVTRYHP